MEICFNTQTKQGICEPAPSGARAGVGRLWPFGPGELGRCLGTTQTSAWKIKTKLAEVMRLDNDRSPLEGRIEMDDAYLGGKRSGGKSGRGSPGKRPIVVAVQSSDGRTPMRLKVRRIARFKRKRVTSLTQRSIAPGAFVTTDGLACFRGVADAGCVHHPIVARTSRHGAGHPSFHWLDTVLANIKTAIVATYKAVRKKHLVRTLAEFEWRFNNRENLAAMIPLLGAASARTKPATYRTLKWADYGA